MNHPRLLPGIGMLAVLLLAACRPVPAPPDGLVQAIDLPSALPERDADAARRHVEAGDAEWEAQADPSAVARARASYWRAALSDPSLYSAYWKAARACIAIGEAETVKAARTDTFERGSGIALLGIDVKPERVEAHYYYAINLGLLANDRRSIAHDAVKTMMQHLERAASLDPSFDHGGAYRALALVYARAPNWPVSVGDEEAALEHARKAVEQDPEFPPNQLALAETLAENGMKDESRAALERGKELIRTGSWPDWQSSAFQEEADSLRKKVGGGA